MSLPITVLLALVFSAGLLGCDTAPESEATGNASVGTTPVLTEAPRIGHLAPDFVLTTLTAGKCASPTIAGTSSF